MPNRTKNAIFIAGRNLSPNNQVVLNISLGNMIILNKKMVAAHAVESETAGNHKVSVTFADGRKSLLELDDQMCKALLKQLF